MLVELSDQARETLEKLREIGPCRTAQLRDALGVKEAALYSRLKTLLSKGLISQDGFNRPWSVVDAAPSIELVGDNVRQLPARTPPSPALRVPSDPVVAVVVAALESADHNGMTPAEVHQRIPFARRNHSEGETARVLHELAEQNAVQRYLGNRYALPLETA